MKIVSLMENTEGREGCLVEHGLAFYVETAHHRILADTGASDRILANAERVGVDLSLVDTIVLSHGHYDHADGLPYVLKSCPQAEVYLQKGAFDAYYSVKTGVRRYIGVSEQVKALSRLHWVEGNLVIDEELKLFAGMKPKRVWPVTNANMKVLRDAFEQDDFRHEQCLLVETDGARVLFSGCAHSGILNIMDRCQEVYGVLPDLVLSGFHMMRSAGLTEEDRRLAAETAEELKAYPSRFLTCHCTGWEAYELMKVRMGEQLGYMHCGETVTI